MSSTIADFISEDLRARIREARPLPSPLSLAQLAEHYNVSLTPVRQATQVLIDEGVLTRHANGRLSITADVAATDTRDVSTPCPVPPPVATDWESELVDEIIARSLRGDDEYLREEACAKRYQVGRTTLRSTFNRLAGKGLLVHVPRCGWRVRTFDEEDLQAYLVTREVLELAALDLARPHLDPADLHVLRQANAPAASDAPARLNNDLHRYLVEKSGNRYIQDFFERHGLYYAALFDYAAPETQVMSAMARQHHQVIDALLLENWDEARRVLSEHIRAQYPIVKRLLANLTINEP